MGIKVNRHFFYYENGKVFVQVIAVYWISLGFKKIHSYGLVVTFILFMDSFTSISKSGVWENDNNNDNDNSDLKHAHIHLEG